MLTGFKARAVNQKTQEEQKKTEALHQFMRELLSEALQEAIVEDNLRVHIEGEPYRVEFKFPGIHNLQSIKKALDDKSLVPFESKVVGGEILQHSFKLPVVDNNIFEALYRPISRPRL